ncbi:MAG: hypothetical protein NTY90_05470 [Candidatus Micrarchaeota archaeon]|nr:hypothetical protein [Candidatus Micrarchaeota archaeon]
MNVNLGTPYIAILDRIMAGGYAGSRVEVIRQALLAYRKQLEEEEEVRLVNKGIKAEMRKIREGKVKLIPLEEAEKKYGLV